MIELKGKTIVVSAINFSEGGPLTILIDCLLNLSKIATESRRYKIVAFVYDKSKCYFPNIHYIEIQQAKKSWLKRLYIEYYLFNIYSKKIKPFLWLSLHDITPRVRATKQAIYFHNPTPFRKISISDLYFSPKVFVFSLFYKYLYRINARRNDYIIVQQDWLRNSFSSLVKVPSSKIIVAPPNHQHPILDTNPMKKSSSSKCLFFYPSFPRSFKNFEIICEATSLLELKGITNFEVAITISGKENRYAHYLREKYKHVQSISFLGLLTREEVEYYYNKASCLLFPSLLETWGLPISEFSNYNKPMLLAKLPYAYETASGAKYVDFFNPSDPKELAHKMKLMIENDFSNLHECPQKHIEQPFAQSWIDLFELLLK